jgi:rare lipoprotein A
MESSSWFGVKPRVGLAVSMAALLAACSGSGGGGSAPPDSGARINRPLFTEQEYGVSSSPRVASGQSIRKGGGSFKLGSPYKVAGRWYVPREEPGYDRSGVGSWYGDDFHGRKTANGEIFDRHALTAAHPTLPLPSYAYVTNLQNGRTLLVRVNDRGPYVNGRIIDLSHASARALGYDGAGHARVRVRYAGRAPLNGDDRRERQYLAQQPWLRGGSQVAAYKPPSAPVNVPQQFPDGTAGRWSPAAYRAGLAGKPVPEGFARPPGRMAVTRATPEPSYSDPPREVAQAPGGGGLVWQASPRGRVPEYTGSTDRPDTSGEAYVQVGVFRQRGEAERLRAELGSLGPVEVAPVQGPEGTRYRVRVGPMAASDARATQARIAAQGHSGSTIVTE